MAEIASAYVSLLPSAQGFGRGVESQVGGEMRSSGSRLGGLLGSALKIGLLAAAAGAGAAFVSGLKSAAEYQKLQAQTAQVLKSTGGAANISAKGITNLANTIAGYSDGNDEAIQAGQNLLLTFTNIKNGVGKGNDIFSQTTKIMADMSIALGQDTKSSALQLGKALNDPIKGVSALSRVGVSFTEAQKEQIKTLVESGNTMGAQKVILGELNKEFGGSAKALGKTFSGSVGRLKDAFGDLLRDAVMPLLPALTSLANTMTANLPKAVAVVGSAFGSVKTFLAPFVAQLQGLFGQAGGGAGIMAGITAFGAAIAVQLVPVLKQMAATFTGVILPAVTRLATYVGTALLPILQRIATVIGTQVVPILASFAQFFYGTLYPAIVKIAITVAEKLQPVFDQWIASIKTQVLPTIEKALVKLREWQPTIQKIVLVVTKVIGKILEFAAIVLAKVLPVVIRFQVFMATHLVTALIKAIEYIARTYKKVYEFGQAFADAIAPVVRFAAKVIEKTGEVLKVVTALPRRMVGALRSGVVLMVGIGKDLIAGLVNGLRAAGQAVIDALGGIVDSAISSAKKKLHISSPSKLFHQIGKWTMEGFANGINVAGPKVLKAMQSALDKVVDQTTSVRDRIKGNLDGVLSDFASLRDSIASSFTGDLFGVSAIESSLTETTFTAAQTVGQAFMSNLLDKKGQLKELLGAFRKLKGWGIPAQFLSQLFSSGNGALILELAGGTQAQASSAVSLFGDVQSLSNQLGGQVARNQYGPQIKRLEDKLGQANRHLKHLDTLAKDLAKALDDASAKANRGAAA